MKIDRPLLLALLLVCAPLVGAPVSLQAASAAPAAVRQDTHTEFRTRFKQAAQLNSDQEMAKLVRTFTDEAIIWIMETAEAICTEPTEELETRMAHLRKAWKTAKGGKFCDRMYEYFSLLDPTLKPERVRLKAIYEKKRKEYSNNLEKKENSKFTLLSQEFAGIGAALEQVGDQYFASQAWLMVGLCEDEPNRADKADLYKACKGFRKCMETRLSVDLKDRTYVEVKQRYEFLKGAGYDRKKPDPNDPDSLPDGPRVSADAITASMAFDLVEKVDTYKRPLYIADDIYPIWPSLYLQKKESVAKFTSLAKLSPTVTRVGSSEVRIDADRDGEPDMRIPLTGNREPIQFQIGEGDEQRDWACLALMGQEKEMYQGVEVNMAPDDNQMTIYLYPASSMVGDLGGKRVRVFDDNMDGIYGSPPVQWGHIGVTKGALHPELDSLVVGSSKRALPWSEIMNIDGKWYQLEVLRGGLELRASPIEVETGTLKLKFKGGKPGWVVVRGQGRYENCFFEVTTKGTEIPRGTWRLYYGELRKGAKKQMIKTLILPGKKSSAYIVEPGETEVVELGAPFGYDFEIELEGNTVKVLGQTIVVTGKDHERYERPWGCVPRPLASWRKVGSKRSSKPEKMNIVLDQDTITKDGWRQCWSPFDLSLPLKGGAEEAEVQLTEKKNKLFGKIASDWKD